MNSFQIRWRNIVTQIKSSVILNKININKEINKIMHTYSNSTKPAIRENL